MDIKHREVCVLFVFLFFWLCMVLLSSFTMLLFCSVVLFIIFIGHDLDSDNFYIYLLLLLLIIVFLLLVLS